MTALYYTIDTTYFVGYFILFSALIVTLRSDLETLLISRLSTLALVPVGIIFSFTDHIPIAPLNSLMGAAAGYLFLWLIATIFYALTHKEGIGQGDLDLLALIGSFTGIIGGWASILIGSVLGSAIGTLYLIYTGQLKRHAKIPFGSFLAIGAIVYVLFQDYITALLLGIPS